MRRSGYIWDLDTWPTFRWEAASLLEPLAEARHLQGRLLGRMSELGFDLQREAHVQALTTEAVKTSEIEGEHLNVESVRSSLARRLGVPWAGSEVVDRKVEGVVEMMLDATSNFAAPLTARRLFGWHAALFPTGYSGMHRIIVGGWRDDREGPMRVVSGPLGHQRVHYEAPPATRLDEEINRFLEWFNAPMVGDGVLRSGIAHLWFLTIHPFEDGNGRIARAIADQALAQCEGAANRFYSVSRQINAERKTYYDVLERTQQGDGDITAWLQWYLACFSRALTSADVVAGQVLRKASFWKRHADKSITERQRRVLNRFLDGFEGKLTARKWAALGKCSVDTAQRDIQALLELDMLRRLPGGSKNTAYEPAWET
ncbi:MAG: Fic family protein [Myxococcota bacterium]